MIEDRWKKDNTRNPQKQVSGTHGGWPRGESLQRSDQGPPRMSSLWSWCVLVRLQTVGVGTVSLLPIWGVLFLLLGCPLVQP